MDNQGNTDPISGKNPLFFPQTQFCVSICAPQHSSQRLQLCTSIRNFTLSEQ